MRIKALVKEGGKRGSGRKGLLYKPTGGSIEIESAVAAVAGAAKTTSHSSIEFDPLYFSQCT